MCEFQSAVNDYQTKLISKLWKAIYALVILCILLVILFSGLAVWGIKYFQSFEYIEETETKVEYSYQLEDVDVATIGQKGDVYYGQSGSNNNYNNFNKEEEKEEEKVNKQ